MILFVLELLLKLVQFYKLNITVHLDFVLLQLNIVLLFVYKYVLIIIHYILIYFFT
jgi:hypothetical protein